MHAERLVRAGLRTVVVEQTETPEMLRVRNENRPAGQAKVRRCSHTSHCCGIIIGPLPFVPLKACERMATMLKWVDIWPCWTHWQR